MNSHEEYPDFVYQMETVRRSNALQSWYWPWHMMELMGSYVHSSVHMVDSRRGIDKRGGYRRILTLLTMVMWGGWALGEQLLQYATNGLTGSPLWIASGVVFAIWLVFQLLRWFAPHLRLLTPQPFSLINLLFSLGSGVFAGAVTQLVQFLPERSLVLGTAQLSVTLDNASACRIAIVLIYLLPVGVGYLKTHRVLSS